MARARTIQIFLPTGDPRGIRVGQLTTSILQVIEVPRALLEDFRAMPESKQVGLYFLIGDHDGLERSSLYIGQSGEVGARLAQHHKEKDFWSRVLIAHSLTNSLTQTHALFLEWLSIRESARAGRYQVENGNAGSKPHTPAPLEADCLELFDTARILVASLGQPIFESLAGPGGHAVDEDGFALEGTGYRATGEYTEEGFVVRKGSTARVEVAPSARGSIERRRKSLLDEGALALVEGVYVFQRDVLFGSPSGASDMVAGSATNGWVVWKSKDGRTLDELKRS
ncbi:MAG: GIY-YIG nuclease family protein [Myxococcaceae bacterium]|nr:GIY-YIG nuclease family protein [Myxococcaceae bacterium]